ncbi:MAG: hypothetical protein NT080_14370 [Spirochaetes bacterium]|nr:hypothetical protein [Spirochaetota bacterium]
MQSMFIFTVFIVISIGMTAAILYSRTRSIGVRREQARILASETGFSYSDGWEALRAFNAENNAGQSLAMLEKLPPFLRGLFEGSAPWRLEGIRDGIRVAVYEETRSSGRSSMTYIIAKAYYRTPLAFRMKAGKEGFFTRIGKTMFGLKDVEVGVQEFDDAVRIVADDESAAGALFSRSQAQSAFLTLIRRFPEAVAGRAWIVREKAGSKMDSSELSEVLELLVAFSNAVA